MTRRKRRAALGLGLAIIAFAVALDLATRGLTVTFINITSSPLLGLKLSYPGGSIVVPAIEPGASFTCRLPVPLARSGRAREVPVMAAFNQDGERSEPFRIRCAVGWSGRSNVRLEATENKVNRSVTLTATVGDPVLFTDRLVRRVAMPWTSQPGFYGVRWQSWGTIVIRRHHWPHYVREQLVTFLRVQRRYGGHPLYPVILAMCVVEVGEDVHAERFALGQPATPPLLPFRDLHEAQADTRTNIVQSPLFP